MGYREIILHRMNARQTEVRPGHERVEECDPFRHRTTVVFPPSETAPASSAPELAVFGVKPK